MKRGTEFLDECQWNINDERSEELYQRYICLNKEEHLFNSLIDNNE
jgi:hypothetical protein